MRFPWRVGRSVGRTIYDADDKLIGMMDTPELAAAAVHAVNNSLEGRAGSSCPPYVPRDTCKACGGNIAPGKTCHRCGREGPLGQGLALVPPDGRPKCQCGHLWLQHRPHAEMNDDCTANTPLGPCGCHGFKPGDVVHLLLHGAALCGLPGIQADWPEGHKWTDFADGLPHATCGHCLRARP